MPYGSVAGKRPRHVPRFTPGLEMGPRFAVPDVPDECPDAVNVVRFGGDLPVSARLADRYRKVSERLRCPAGPMQRAPGAPCAFLQRSLSRTRHYGLKTYISTPDRDTSHVNFRYLRIVGRGYFMRSPVRDPPGSAGPPGAAAGTSPAETRLPQRVRLGVVQFGHARTAEAALRRPAAGSGTPARRSRGSAPHAPRRCRSR